MEDFVKTPDFITDKTLITFDQFQTNSAAALQNIDTFWAAMARSNLDFIKDFTEIRRGDFNHPVKIEWFPDAVMNVSANCLDRHLVEQGDKVAIIWVGDMPGTERKITYQEMTESVARWANVLKEHNVKRGDRVVLYLPMIPEAVMAMLACARIGAVHSVVFAGFSSNAVKDRIIDCNARLVITADEGYRGGKTTPLKATVDEAIQDLDVKHVLVVKRTGGEINMQPGRDHYIEELIQDASNVCDPEPMNAEDPLFILYTSGSTGRPKGLVHTQAGYLLYAMTTFKTLFDYRPEDVYFCSADVGWITGHSYVVYGPLAAGATVVMYEGIPTYPEADRYWKIIDQYKVTIFYTAPTALRALMQMGDEHLETSSRSSLRILGSVGEPINPEAWQWYFDKVGHGNCAVIDTWWQTETGGHMIAPPPSTPSMKPGWAMTPFWGIDPVLIDPSNQVIEGAGEGGLFIRHPWPGIARTIYGGHDRFLNTYFSQVAGLYCTSDGAIRDEQGHIRITGRVDDVINVSGHRFGTAEIESALVSHKNVAEAAVIGRDHEIKGTGIYAYVTLNHDVEPTEELKKELNQHVRKQIGAIASLDWLQWAPGLPKTRSGKIMRRILRKIAENQIDQLGDTSTLADPGVVKSLIENRID